jgi:copper chaperone CopZ
MRMRIKEVSFDVNTVGCMSCKIAIEHAGKHIDGVKDVEFDLGTHTIKLSYDEEKETVPEQLRVLVDKIGYEAVLLDDK